MNKQTLISALCGTAFCVLTLATVAVAQPSDGGPVPPGPTGVPLDGGASLLLAGGVAYGLKRLRARRTKG